MKERSCTCGKPLRDNATVCPDCIHRLRRHLADQAAHLIEIEIELARATKKVAENDGGRASTETGWTQAGDQFLDDITADDLREWDRRARAAANAMHRQRFLLVSWTKVVVEDRIAKKWPADSIPAMASLLIMCLPVLRNHDGGPDLAYEFRELNRQIMRVIDNPPNRARFTVGPCPQEYTDEFNRKEPCPGEVEAIIPSDESPRIMRCKECRMEWLSSKNEWVNAGKRIEERRAQMKQQRTMAEAMGRKAS